MGKFAFFNSADVSKILPHFLILYQGVIAIFNKIYFKIYTYFLLNLLQTHHIVANEKKNYKYEGFYNNIDNK